MLRLRVLVLVAPVVALACSSHAKQSCVACDGGQADLALDLPEDRPLTVEDTKRDNATDRVPVDKTPRPVVDGAPWPSLDGAANDVRGPMSVYDAPYISFHNFDDGSSTGWFAKLWPGGNALDTDWSVIGGDTGWVYSEGVDDATTWRIAFDGIELIMDQVVEARMRVPEFYGKEPSYVAALFGRYDPDIDSGYFVALRGDGTLIVRRRELGQNMSWRDGVSAGIQPGVWYTVRLEVIGSVVNAFLDGQPVYSVVDPNPLGAGTVGLGTYGATLEVDQVFITQP